MIRLSLLLLSVAIAFGQYAPPSGSFIERRLDGPWLVITNTPDVWVLSWSTDLTTWVPYISKHSLAPLRTVELRLGEPTTNAPIQFWRLALERAYYGNESLHRIELLDRLSTFMPPVESPPLPVIAP